MREHRYPNRPGLNGDEAEGRETQQASCSTTPYKEMACIVHDKRVTNEIGDGV